MNIRGADMRPTRAKAAFDNFFAPTSSARKA
jgi:hypothetical protein